MSAQLGGTAIGYRLVRARRRSIGFVIDANGLTVRAPMRASARAIAEALEEKSAWITRTLSNWAVQQLPWPSQQWRHGATVPYRGEALPMLVQQSRRTRVEADMFALKVWVRSQSPEEIATAVEGWLWGQAHALLPERVHFYSRRLALPPPQARFSRARTQWGSCSADGVIRLHWRLIQLEPALADYVVAHEVAHRLELNHSPRFWAAVERIYPDYRRSRRELARYAPLLD